MGTLTRPFLMFRLKPCAHYSAFRNLNTCPLAMMESNFFFFFALKIGEIQIWTYAFYVTTYIVIYVVDNSKQLRSGSCQPNCTS